MMMTGWGSIVTDKVGAEMDSCRKEFTVNQIERILK